MTRDRATDTTVVERPIKTMVAAIVLALGALVVPASGANTVDATEDDPVDTEPAVTVEEPTEPVDAPPGTASSYLSFNPIRILDTRSDPGIKRVHPNSAFSIDPISDTGVAEAAGVEPDDITAVIVNTTMVRSAGVGFGTVWPTGNERLATSTNNTEFSGHTIPNLVIAPIGLDNKISMYASVEADVILDVLGVFVAADEATAGRFVSLGPTRAYDSRIDDPEIPAGGTQVIDLKDAGVPADASGVVLNVTSVQSQGRGFYRVWSADAEEPDHSSMNVLDVAYNAGNQVITGVSDGRIQVFTDVGGGLTVDVTGYFTGDSAEASTDGLFVPFTPGRLLNTRATSGATAGTDGAKIPADEKYTLQVTDRLDVPEIGAKAVALNITAVRPEDRGFVQAYPGGADEPDTSSLNFTDADQIVPNHAITSLNTTTGEITLQPSEETHIVVDASGYFLGEDAVLPSSELTVAKTVTPTDVLPEPLEPDSPTSGPYDFLFDRGAYFASGVRPTPTIRAAWSNCMPLRYALNIDLAENDAQIEALLASIDEIEVATGIDFQFGGLTSAGMNIADDLILPERIPESLSLPFMYLPPTDDGTGSVDMVIGFSDESGTPELSGGVIGIGGSLRTDIDSSGRAEQVRGFAVIDLEDLYVGAADSAETLSNIKATTTHELGHVMGLGHVDTTTFGQGLNEGFSSSVIRDQLMFPALNPLNEPDFDDGDLQGLHELYGNRSCSAVGQLGGNGDAAEADIDWSDVAIVKTIDDF